MGTADQLTGIKQRIYLPVPREYNYTASFYAKHVSGSTRVTISLRARGSDLALTSASAEVSKSEWAKYTVPLKLARYARSPAHHHVAA